MGSLPNLHELGKEEGGGALPPVHQKIGPALSNPHQHSVAAGHSSLTQEERNRILHRHSTHCRGKTKTAQQDNGNRTAKILYDDFMLEQMAAYSPISSRSTRNLTHSVRRRDSINSSIGANSVRRLIAVVRNTNSRMGPVYSRKVLLKNLTLMCLTHVLVTATFLPFLALQGSVSVWMDPIDNIPITINVGSFLLALMHISAACSAVFAPSLIQKLGTNAVICFSYATLSVFYASHLHPVLYVLIPGYILFGLCLGPLSVARITFLMTVSTKLSYIFGEEDEETKVARRTCIIRRVARAFQAAYDFGLIFGSVLAAVLITTTINLTPSYDSTTFSSNSTNLTLKYACNATTACDGNCSMTCVSYAQPSTYDYSAFLDDIFDVDELGDRLCGSNACPSRFKLGQGEGGFKVLPKTTSVVLIGVYATLAASAAVVAAFLLDRIKLYVYQDPMERSVGLAALRGVRESFKDVRLQLAAPLSLFIGLEQAFMYADFSKSYVVCTLGIHRLNLVFLCMGLLQSIAACTLSMLLRTIRRYYVIAVGFMFHACLLMVQILWKPMGDDPALFYVISAAWGVCNAVWEMMNFSLLTGLYADSWEAPFANSLFFRFLGLAIAFGVHGLLCNWIKLYVLGSTMLLAVVPFAWLEMRLENMRRVKNVSRL